MPEPTNVPTVFTQTDAELVQSDYQDALIAGGSTALVKVLQWNAYAVAPIPLELNADYLAANQTKKQRMLEISQEAYASGEEWETKYLEIYNAEF